MTVATSDYHRKRSGDDTFAEISPSSALCNFKYGKAYVFLGVLACNCGSDVVNKR